jgi:uncharacterized protein (DUF2461 family)
VIILEALRIIAIALSPVTPSLCWRIYGQLGFSKDQFDTVTWVSLSLSLSHAGARTHTFDITCVADASYPPISLATNLKLLLCRVRQSGVG